MRLSLMQVGIHVIYLFCDCCTFVQLANERELAAY